MADLMRKKAISSAGVPEAASSEAPPARSHFLRAVGAIAWKDLAAEFRSRELFSACGRSVSTLPSRESDRRAESRV